MLTAKEALRQSVDNMMEIINGKISKYIAHGITKLVLNLVVLPEKVYKILSAKGYKVSYQLSKDNRNITVISWGEEDEGSNS